MDDENLFKTEDENQSETEEFFKKESSSNDHLSEFTPEECLKYVEAEITKGATIQNPKALAMSLFQTGKSDAFIRAALYPEKQSEIDRKIFGEPRKFTDEPCTVCFGAKMADVGGKGFRACVHCKNERGKATGFEPEGEVKDENED